MTASAGPFRDSGGARVSVILRGSHATLTAGRGEGPWSSPSRAVCPPPWLVQAWTDGTGFAIGCEQKYTDDTFWEKGTRMTRSVSSDRPAASGGRVERAAGSVFSFAGRGCCA